MMKKNGFTLAEVLITLAIIGVVATMTLPALMTNTQEQQARTALKKGINTLTEAAQMNEAVAGFNYASLTAATPNAAADFTDENAQEQSLFGILANRTNLDYRKTDAITTQLEGTNTTMYFQDGTAIIFNSGSATSTPANTAIQPDGLPLGFPVVFDTNGAKGPNILSNCVATPLGVSEDRDANFSLRAGTEFDNSACATKTNRIIKDQFTIRLRGGYAQPSGAAAHWIFNETITGGNAGGNQQL